MARLRVVLDTNVLVPGIAYPMSVPGRIVNLEGASGSMRKHFFLRSIVVLFTKGYQM